MYVAPQTPRLLAGLAFALLLSGCQTPDLKPFAEASDALVSGINQGGDMAINPLAGQAVMVNGVLVAPGAPEHPANKLASLWAGRRAAADSILAYSQSLAAINEAAANRKANASALVDSVRHLASAIPGVSVGSNAAGDLVVFALGAGIEVKAWHDMAAAVKAADPAVQAIAGLLQQDFTALSAELESVALNQLMTSTTPALREVERLYAPVRAKQKTQRVLLANDLASVGAAEELIRLDRLRAGLEPDLAALQAEKGRLEDTRATGANFFAAVGGAIEAWAAAHHDLARAFEEHRRPNLSVLAARAQELNRLVKEFRSERKAEAAP
jgi:hypothetical protein